MPNAFSRTTRSLDAARAMATIGRDREALRAEAALERYDWDALDALVPAGEVLHG